MLTCTKTFHFDAAHRVMGHAGKCAKLHGHRYVAETTFSIDALPALGMVIDFAIIKEKLGTWIDNNLDHNTILCIEDHQLGCSIEASTEQAVYYMKNNPTAENIAAHLLYDVLPTLFQANDAICIKVRVYETPTCYAEAFRIS